MKKQPTSVHQFFVNGCWIDATQPVDRRRSDRRNYDRRSGDDRRDPGGRNDRRHIRA